MACHTKTFDYEGMSNASYSSSQSYGVGLSVNQANIAPSIWQAPTNYDGAAYSGHQGSAYLSQGFVPVGQYGAVCCAFPMSPKYGVTAQEQSSHGNPYQGNAPQTHSSYSQDPDFASDNVFTLRHIMREVLEHISQQRHSSEPELAQAKHQWSTVNEQGIRLNKQHQRTCTMLNGKDMDLSKLRKGLPEAHNKVASSFTALNSREKHFKETPATVHKELHIARMDGAKWKGAHAWSEQALSTMKSRWDHQGSALIAGLDGEAATIRNIKCVMEYACKADEEKQAELNVAQKKLRWSSFMLNVRRVFTELKCIAKRHMSSPTCGIVSNMRSLYIRKFSSTILKNHTCRTETHQHKVETQQYVVEVNSHQGKCAKV